MNNNILYARTLASRIMNDELENSNDDNEKKLTVETSANHVYFYANVDTERCLALIKEVRDLDNTLRNERLTRNIPDGESQVPIWLHIQSNGGDLFAGLAAADQLNRVGHNVTVFEKSSRIGGLLRYGIPEFKMEKRFLDRRISLMEAEGVVFRTGVNVGADISAEQIRHGYDSVLLAGGAGQPRDLKVPGRELAGVHFAMEYLTQQNRRNEGEVIPEEEAITATDKRVVIIGGGDTGADCLGTVHRQNARSVAQFELLPQPPDIRTPDNPSTLWTHIFRTSSAHEEGGERVFSVSTDSFSGTDGRVSKLHGTKVEIIREDGRMSFKPVPDSGFNMDVDLVLLAMGFVGPEREGLLAELDVKLTERGNVWRDTNWMTSQPSVFAAGDMHRGQSLIVWAIAEGRSAARGIDTHLMVSSTLTAPV